LLRNFIWRHKNALWPSSQPARIAGIKLVNPQRHVQNAARPSKREPLLLGWYLKEELRELWNQPSRTAMETFLRDWCQKAAQTAGGRFHASGILNYATHRITSGLLEGINNKIKTLTKRSYGFRDEEFFLLRLLSLHHSKFKLVG
jgi:transposase